MEIVTILWKEMIFFRRKMFNIISAAMIQPLLYMIAFGWGLGSDAVIEGHSYMHFVVPGIVAMTTMNTSFSAISVRLNSMRLHDRSFEFYLTSPVNVRFLALGFILSGVFRGMLAAAIVLFIAFIFGVYIHITWGFVLICLLNSFLFSAFAYAAAMTINSHYDMNRFNTFVMVPMTFLCGTFFSLEKLPVFLHRAIMVLPLAQSTTALRAIALGKEYSPVCLFVLLAYCIAFYVYSVRISRREIF